MIKDSNGKFTGTTETQGNKTVVKEFGSGKIVSSYNSTSDTTLDWKTNRFNQSNTSISKLK